MLSLLMRYQKASSGADRRQRREQGLKVSFVLPLRIFFQEEKVYLSPESSLHLPLISKSSFLGFSSILFFLLSNHHLLHLSIQSWSGPSQRSPLQARPSSTFHRGLHRRFRRGMRKERSKGSLQEGKGWRDQGWVSLSSKSWFRGLYLFLPSSTFSWACCVLSLTCY